MCRHLLPRFDFPATQALHGIGRFIAAHPASASAVVLLPLCAAIVVFALRRVRRPSAGLWGAPRPAALPSRFAAAAFGPARSV